jgi:hypothetical protein
VSARLHTVHVRVTDAATGQPTPVRIRFANRNREYFAPFGRLVDIPSGISEDVGGNLLLGSDESGREEFAYIDGTCEIGLPAEPLFLQVTKGLEYLPITRDITLAPGKLALRLEVQRWADLRSGGWYAGDSHALFLSPHAALLEADAEDLAVVNLLITEWQTGDGRLIIPNSLAFSGQRALLQTDGYVVAVNTLNCGGPLGSVSLLNSHRTIFPLSIGRRAGDPLNWTLADWCNQCHRKGGLVLWTRFGQAWSEGVNAGGEALAELILGRIDAIDVDRIDWNELHQILEWYRILNAGFRVPLTGGSGKKSNCTALGCVRTYARLLPGQEFNYRNWIESVRSGRTFITNGPLLQFTVNDQRPGAVVDLSPGTDKVALRAEARSIVPFDNLEIVLNGKPIQHASASGSPCYAVLETETSLPASGWLAARCSGRAKLHTSEVPQHIAAHTSPVYVRIGGSNPAPDAVSVATLLGYIDAMLNWVRSRARFETDWHHQALAGIFQDARELLEGRMSSVP